MRTTTEEAYPALGPEYDDDARPMVSRFVVYSIIAAFLAVSGTAVYEVGKYLIY